MLRGVQVFVSGVALVAVMLAGANVAPGAGACRAGEARSAPRGRRVVITILIKPDKTADFESVLAKYKEALAKSEKPARKQQVAGMKIFKSTQPAQDNAVYIMYVDPVVKGEEYDISRVIAEVFPTEVQEIFNKYKEAFAGRAITPLNKVP